MCVPLASAKVTGPESARRRLKAPHTRQVLNQPRRAMRALSSELAGSRQCTGLVAVVSQHRQLVLLVFLPMIAVIGCSIIYQSIII